MKRSTKIRCTHLWMAVICCLSIALLALPTLSAVQVDALRAPLSQEASQGFPSPLQFGNLASNTCAPLGTSMTSPLPGAVSKPAAWRISLPWDSGVSHTVTCAYGCYKHWNISNPGYAKDYYALDFDLGRGDTVRAIAAGTVRYADWTTGGWSTYGQSVYIDHNNGYYSFYAHLDTIAVSGTQTVVPGQPIGTAGGSGSNNNLYYWDPHLHFSLYKGSSFTGGPYGGQATVPEPFSGTQDYVGILYNQCLVAGSSDPDDERTIVYGQTLYGTISPALDRDTYYFNGTAGQTVTIRMNKASGSSLDSYLELWKDNSLIGTDDDSGGNLNSLLVRTLSQSGTYRIIAKGYSTSTGGYTLSLTQETPQDPDDGRWLAYGQSLNGTINPSNDRDTYYFGGTAGRVISIRMNKASGSSLDSYLELWNPSGSKVAENDDGGGDRNSWLVATLSQNGTYRIVARSWNYSSSGGYTISVGCVTSQNVARGKGTVASSVEFYGVESDKAVDGNMSTRWSSRFVDPGWIQVDLGQDYTIDQVVLKWETAYGRRYGIYVWRGTEWQNIYWTDYGDGGTDTINFSPTSARWVLMYGIERGTPWGYSLWEFEIYSNAATVVPLVPPGPPDKPPDTVSPEEPLAPTAPGKDVEALSVGNGEDGQENTPLPDTAPDTPPDVDTSTTYYPPTATITVISPTMAYQGWDVISFTGMGVDSDEDGQSIVGYNWRSDIDNALSITNTFTLPASTLSLGVHTIYLQVQDDEGVWSEEVTATLTVRPTYRMYLPVIFRNWELP